MPLAFSGHDHNYERILLDGVTYIVSGGGSPVLYPKTEQVEGSKFFQRRMHFVLVEVFEGRISLRAIDLDGMGIDHATIPIDEEEPAQ